MSALLKLDSVTRSFGGLTAVKDLSLEVNPGEIMGLIGPNGAGKTTVFNLITGVYKPDTGKIVFEGNSIAGKKTHHIARLGVSRTFQTVRPLPKMTVMENVMMGSLFGRNHTRSLRHARDSASEILRYTALSGKADKLAGDLTLAEQRRLELARSLATKPKLLLLDEVMAGLNPSEISDTLDLLFRLNTEKQITLLVIEHVVKAMMKLCKRIVVMDHGTKIAEGLPQEIVNNAEVITAYMGEKRAGAKKAQPQSDATGVEKV
ncbi:MAG: ABC transporter ATP-binding protein [Nitrososphaerota archaeon]|nr:ABC transporter ATP-binding protein [Nitrososphaerota archaeon]